MLFKRPKKLYSVLKFYSIGDDQLNLDKKRSVEFVLGLFESEFGEFPENYDIDGPYRIPKGRGAKLKTFKKKLKKFGYEKCYGMSGVTEEHFGFRFLFGARSNEKTTYSELVIWYEESKWAINFKDIARSLSKIFSISTGFQLELPNGYCFTSETKIKRNIFTESVEVSNKHLEWVSGFSQGAYRAVQKYNLWNEMQLENAITNGIKVEPIKVGKHYYVEKNA